MGYFRLAATLRGSIGAAALLMALASCHSGAERRREFVRQFYAEDFRGFHDTSFLLRGRDEADNQILFFFCHPADSASEGNQLVAVLTTVPATTTVLRVKYEDRCIRCLQAPDSLSLVRFTQRFLRYRVSSLGADTLGNVSVQFRSGWFGPSDLVRVADTTSLSYEFREKYRQVRGPWYERRAAE